MLGGINFKKVSFEDNVNLMEHFIEAEIMEEVWNCDGDKSSGPDGYNLRFIKEFWNLLKEDVVDFFMKLTSCQGFPS